MKSNTIARFAVLSLAAVLLAACGGETFKIRGHISGAKGETLYLDRMTITAAETLDSVRLGAGGKFKFKADAPDYPDLYRLRLGGNNIIVAIDSTETVEIDATKENMTTGFSVEGSAATEKIRELRASAMRIQTEAKDGDGANFNTLLAGHRKMATEIILEDTKSMAAYYAVHQTLNGMYFFSPNNREQLQLWAAVATAFDLYRPDYYRSKELKEITLRSLRAQRMADAGEITITAPLQGMIDIALPDRTGETVALSSLKGKVVLIDFSAYSMEGASAHTLFLREMYDRWHDAGLEIYQVSIDENKLLWMEQSRTTPWICVRDADAPRSQYLLTYNVTEIPTMFIMNRYGDIIGRFDHEQVEQAIREAVNG